jgi:hypothetical protein
MVETTEKLIRISSFIKRKPGVSKEDFYRYWINVHAPCCKDFMLRHGVVEYVQVRPGREEHKPAMS